MRKSLSILLAVAMVFTMFAGVVAAEQPSDIDRLKAAGVIVGDDVSGDTMDDEAWLRQNVVVLLSRLYGVSEADAKAYGADHGFADVTNSYYDGFITWGKENDIVKGRSDVAFGYGELVTAQELATFLLRVIGIDEWENAVDVAVDKGIFASSVDNRTQITRGQSYNAIVNLLDSEVEGGGTLGASLNLKGWEVEVADVSAAVVAANQIKVSFSAAVKADDTKIEVLWGMLPADFTAKWADDNKSVILESEDNYRAGNYTVKVNDEEFKFEIKAQELVSFTIDTEFITAINGQKIKYSPVDQYGNVYKTTTGFSATATKVTAGGDVVSIVAGPNADNEFTISDLSNNEEQVVVVNVSHSSGLTQTKTYTVLPAAYVNSIVLGQPEVKENHSRIEIDQDEIVLPIQLINQYGGEMTLTEDLFKAPAAPAPDLTQFRFISSSNVVDVSDFTVVDGKLLIKTHPSVFGTVTITAVPLKSPNSTSVTFEVFDKAKLASIVLQQPTELEVEGEELTVGYAATDTFGGDYTLKPADSGNTIHWISSNTNIIPTSGPNSIFVDGDGKIKFTPQQTGQVTLSAYVNGVPQNSLSFDVKAEAVPTKINKVVENPNANGFLYLSQETGFSVVSLGSLEILDQYNRVMKHDNPKLTGAVSVRLKDPANGIIKNDFDDAVQAIKKGKAVAIARYMVDPGDPLATPPVEPTYLTKEFTVEVVSDAEIVDYEVEALSSNLLYTGVAIDPVVDATYAKEIKVKWGKTVEGHKVGIGMGNADRADFTILTTNGNIVAQTLNPGAWNATQVVYGKHNVDDEKGTVTVWKKGILIGEYELTLSNKAPELTKFAFDKAEVDIAKNTAGHDAKANIKADTVKDQYGVGIAFNNAGTWFSTNKSSVDIDRDTGVFVTKDKGTATITFVADNGARASYKVNVTD